MKRWASIAFSLYSMVLLLSQSGLMAKGGRGQGDDLGRGHGSGSVHAQNSNGNGQGTIDRELGKDRATEVGRGKKKGLYKDQYAIGEGRDKDRNRGSQKSDKAKTKKLHTDKKDKDGNN